MCPEIPKKLRDILCAQNFKEINQFARLRPKVSSQYWMYASMTFHIAMF